LSVDPLSDSYPWYTPYQFAGNDPVKYFDVDGAEQAEKLPNGVILLGSDYTRRDGLPLALRRPVVDLAAQKKLKQLRFEGLLEQRQAHLSDGGITSTSSYKFTKEMVNTYGDYVLPLDLTTRLLKGEKVAGWEIGVEVASFSPFGKAAKFIAKPFTIVVKNVGEITSLIKYTVKGVASNARELITVTNSGLRTDALKVVQGAVGDLGDDAIGVAGKSTTAFPDADKLIVGAQSADKSRGWRIDFDDAKKAHYNWWNNDTGEKGAVLFEGTKDQVDQLKEMLGKTYNLPPQK
jgi:hypothetical protein